MKTLSINMEAQMEDHETSDELVERIVSALTAGEINASVEPIEIHGE